MDEGFPERLKHLRETYRSRSIKKPISRQTLSELCGLAPDAVRRYERGEARPSMEALVRLADFFGVSIDYLVGRDG